MAKVSWVLHPHPHTAVEALIRDADLEVIPLKNAGEQLAKVPTGSTVTVTCSVKLGLPRTLELTERAVRAGYQVVPHLAARQLTDMAELVAFVGRLDALGVTQLYVIGGDATEPAGPFASAAELLEALSTIEHGITTIGVGCYPEGHPSISDATLAEALHRAQPHAQYMVSQLCFDPDAISGWLGGIRSDGIALPLHLGLAAPMQIRKLAELSLRIGVGSSVRYLTKQHGFLGNVLRGSSYRPEQLLEHLDGLFSWEEMAVPRLHLFTFNQVESTVDWQASLAESHSAEARSAISTPRQAS